MEGSKNKMEEKNFPPESGAKAIETFLQQYLTKGAISHMKEGLKAGKAVHLYGEQGKGKTTVRNLFAKFGYRVSAPEDVSSTEVGYELPKEIHKVILLEVEWGKLRNDKTVLDAGKILGAIRKEDIESWLNA